MHQRIEVTSKLLGFFVPIYYWREEGEFSFKKIGLVEQQRTFNILGESWGFFLHTDSGRTAGNRTTWQMVKVTTALAK